VERLIRFIVSTAQIVAIRDQVVDACSLNYESGTGGEI
jgi:hypothetical protein